MKIIKEYIMNFFNGFCMSLADSVPGVSGGTIAFLLGFYDKFITSLDDLFRGSLKEKKNALSFLIKIGIGWVIGFAASATILSNLFSTKIYLMSSLFIGFIIAAIPLIIREELTSFKGHFKNIIFTIIGIIVVVAITLLNGNTSLNISITNANIFTYVYLFFAASVAITAMVLPGISGSTLLLVFGLYIPVMGAVKSLLTLDFSVLPTLIVFGFGILFGVVFFVKLIRNFLTNYRSAVCYTIVGMMIGSLFSIVMGPTTLDEPLSRLSFETFDILFFIIGVVLILVLEFIRTKLNKNNNVND